MAVLANIKTAIAKWPYPAVSALAAVAAFGAYTSMYAFRKAFAAGTYAGWEFLHLDYKVWLVIAQILGYTASKFYGIKFIAESGSKNRGIFILGLIGVSWLALLGFALIPRPYNIICLLVNGFPLGLIWGLVFSYLEGRRSTEFMAAVLSISLIFGSGFVKTVGQTLIKSFGVNEYYMPFLTGSIFVLPLILFVLVLEIIPPPTPEDKQLRTERLPMNKQERKAFIVRFFPGIVLTLIIYVLLTVMRDLRDNFEIEIWNGLGIHDATIYAKIDSRISVIVLLGMSLLILIRANFTAFKIIHAFILAGCAIAGIATILFTTGQLNAMWWMTFAGLGLYMGYVPYNAIFFERLIAAFNYKSNVGFIMYVADAIGYLGSVSVLLIREIAQPNVSWVAVYQTGLMAIATIGGVAALLSLLYFIRAAKKPSNTSIHLKYSSLS